MSSCFLFVCCSNQDYLHNLLGQVDVWLAFLRLGREYHHPLSNFAESIFMPIRKCKMVGWTVLIVSHSDLE